MSQQVIFTIYMVIFAYFVAGGIGFYFINLRRTKAAAHINNLKFITYFIIINILFGCIVLVPEYFIYLCLLILLVGLGEMVRVYVMSDYQKPGFFFGSLIIYLLLGVSFGLFGILDNRIVLFTFLVLSIFDAFSQITGQLFGRRKLFPAISPQKTTEGLLGGAVVAFVSSLFLNNIIGVNVSSAGILSGGIIMAALAGDVMSSLFKRKYNIKDFSELLPGHGGFLDRFDSLISGGAFVALLYLLWF